MESPNGSEIRYASAIFLGPGFINALAAQLAHRIIGILSEKNAVLRPKGLPRLMTVRQAAFYLGRTRSSLEHLIHRRIVPVVRIDRRVFIDRLRLDKLIEENPT
jgi:Helix-turn-helix domain